jgi:hypothetical protein
MYPDAAFGAMASQLLLSRPTDADTGLNALVKMTTRRCFSQQTGL